jgi:hypothetical protein
MPDRVNIFISYKKGDVALANAVDKIFGDYGGDRAETFVATKMLPGTLWENWIRDSLAQSHLLFLLFTDPDQDWGWCLFEAGLFLGLDVGDHRHVICIYQPKTNPRDLLSRSKWCRLPHPIYYLCSKRFFVRPHSRKRRHL